jgi:hypothetical protein
VSNRDNNIHREKPKRTKWPVLLLVFLLALYFFVTAILPSILHQLDRSRRSHCGENIVRLGKALYAYAEDHNDMYPTENWCDLLLGGEYVAQDAFLCPGGGKGRCHYAISKNVVGFKTSEIRNGTVLLFETKGGWNQLGGPEILSTENHFGEGCNIFFSGWHARFWNAARLTELKWKIQEDQK